jgi:DNA polymerase-3 subunit beta
LVATDSYRLALRDLDGVSMLAEGQKVLVAAKGLAEVQRLLTNADGEIDVVLGEREVVFRVGTTEVTTRLIEGEFPNYQQLIPSGYPNRLTVARD